MRPTMKHLLSVVISALRISGGEAASLLASQAVRCSRLMAGAKRRTESGWKSAAPMARREASVPSV